MLQSVIKQEHGAIRMGGQQGCTGRRAITPHPDRTSAAHGEQQRFVAAIRGLTKRRHLARR